MTAEKKLSILLFGRHPLITKIERTLAGLGHKVAIWSNDASEADAVEGQSWELDYVISVGSDPGLRKLCQKRKIPYLVWVIHINDPFIFDKKMNDENVILFHFDEMIAQGLRNKGMKHIHYLPIGEIPEEVEIDEHYSKEVSYWGSTGVKNTFNRLRLELKINQQQTADIEEAFYRHILNPKLRPLDQLLTDRWVNQFMDYLPNYFDEKGFVSPKEQVWLTICEKMVEKEREHLVTIVGSRYPLSAYGDPAWGHLAREMGATYCKIDNPAKERPKLYRCSKVNLYLTDHHIPSGIPYRPFAILAAGGFLMVNEKSDIHRYFTNKKDLVVYSTFKEMLELMDYYMNHDEEREAIALQGQKTLAKKCHLKDRIKQMLTVAGK